MSHTGLTDSLRQALQSHPGRARNQLARIVGHPPDSVTSALKRMAERGQAHYRQDGRTYIWFAGPEPKRPAESTASVWDWRAPR